MPDRSKKSIWDVFLIKGTLCILVFAVIFYFLGKETLTYRYQEEANSGCEAAGVIGELTQGTVVEQHFITTAEMMKGITVRFGNYNRPASGKLVLICEDSHGQVLAEAEIDAAQLKDNADFYFNFQENLKIVPGDELVFRLNVVEGAPGSAVTLWSGSKQEGWNLTVNGIEMKSTLYLIPNAYVRQPYTVPFVFMSALLLAAYVLFGLKCKSDESKGKNTAANEVIHIFDKYRFLLTQLISRDFKNKYRRSYLGVLWSLLNPLFMMMIVSAVFSFVFRFNVQNFQVYLILGQVVFNFYSEATQIAVNTVVSSGQLIKKVYLPKYIFTLSKTIFSLINTAISFIAVFLVILFYRVPITRNILFLPYFFLIYFLFVLGVSLTVAAMNVFLRDTQYLYGLVVTALGYVTPIFYPVDTLAPWMQQIIKLNPLYHYVTYLRTILLYGQPPELKQQAVCLLLAIASITIGVRFFFKRQSKFILYI